MTHWDVIVVGGGNAGMSAAIAAATTANSRVLLLEKAPADRSGGNTWFTAGAFRVPVAGPEDWLKWLADPDDPRLARTDLPAYSADDFHADLRRMTEDRCDPVLARVLVDEAADAIDWLHSHGVQFEPLYRRQSYEIDGRLRFWGGLALGVVGGGKGLVAAETAALRAVGVKIRYASPVSSLLTTDEGAVRGVRLADGTELASRAVVLASGGFQANAEMRVRHLGPEWRRAKVRGTADNTGDLLRDAVRVGAARAGQWDGCHAVAWDVNGPAYGDPALTHRFTRGSYPLGIVVNRQGRRFLDEGADFRNYTYARYGGRILDQPDGIAFQIFDARTRHLLNIDEYEMPGASRFEGDSPEELAWAAGIDPAGLAETVRAFNRSIHDGTGVDPSSLDGRSTVGIEPPKSNWALPIDRAPLVAYAVTCGITFTFGGLAVDQHANVLDEHGRPIPQLFAAGEMLGGLFFHNYPGGSGLTAGTVFGRRAGRAAARSPARP